MDDGVGVGGEEGGGEAGGFFAEEEPGVGGEAGGPMRGGDGGGCAGGGRESREPGGEEDGVGADFEKEGGEVVVGGEGDVLEIIHAGAFEVLVGEEEAQGADEVEGGAGGGAEAGDVAGVLGDFGFDEDDFEGVSGEHGRGYNEKWPQMNLGWRSCDQSKPLSAPSTPRISYSKISRIFADFLGGEGTSRNKQARIVKYRYKVDEGVRGGFNGVGGGSEKC